MRARPWDLFIHRLCLAAGELDVRKAYALPAVALLRWAEFFALEPFGGAVEDLRAGMVAATVLNAAAGKRIAKAEDFRVTTSPGSPRRREQSPDAQVATLKALAARGIGRWRNATS